MLSERFCLIFGQSFQNRTNGHSSGKCHKIACQHCSHLPSKVMVDLLQVPLWARSCTHHVNLRGHVHTTSAKFSDALTLVCIFTQPPLLSLLTASAFGDTPTLCTHHMYMSPNVNLRYGCTGRNTCLRWVANSLRSPYDLSLPQLKKI